jgi:integrase
METTVTTPGVRRISAAGVTDLKAAPSLPRLVWSLLWPAVRQSKVGAIRRDNLHDKHWKPLLRRSGLPDIRFHDLRHTCATLLLTKGVHSKIISEVLGHASSAITLDIYSHVIPGLREVAVRAMEDLLFPELQL